MTGHADLQLARRCRRYIAERDALAERLALALMELGRVRDPRLDGLRFADIKTILEAERFFSARSRKLTPEEIAEAIK